MTATDAITEHVTHFQRRVLQDALTDATATYWRRRAATFEAARPRPGDYLGARPDQARIDALDARICATRDACLIRAGLGLVDHWPTDDERRAVA